MRGLGAGMGVWGGGVLEGTQVRRVGARRGHGCLGTGADLVLLLQSLGVVLYVSSCAGRCPSMGPTCRAAAAGARRPPASPSSCPEVGEDLASSGHTGLAACWPRPGSLG